jgi:DNA-binding response OmpR family regulator
MIHKAPFILIVDDDKAIQDFLFDGLTDEGYVCDIASCADEALVKLNKTIFDLILLDIKLPGISGLDLLEIIESKYNTTSVVIISGIEDIDTVVKSMNSGALDYILKPFSITKLIQSIGTVLDTYKPFSGNVELNTYTIKTEKRKKTGDLSLIEMNAIAYGVDAQIDYFDFHSKRVTEKTIELAYCLGIPEERIRKWEVARNELLSERDTRLNVMLGKLKHNKMAQILVRLINSITYIPEYNEKQN